MTITTIQFNDIDGLNEITMDESQVDGWMAYATRTNARRPNRYRNIRVIGVETLTPDMVCDYDSGCTCPFCGPN